MLATVTNASITLRRNHRKLPFARITYEDLDAVTVEYGRFACGQFITSEKEYLPMLLHPELYGIYDGQTWDIDALHALVSPADYDAPAKAGR